MLKRSRMLIPVMACILAIYSVADAQIVGSNCFLHGNYVEVGVNTCGAYGSNALPPAGYHPTAPMTGLGFVADSDGDGWDVGYPPYCGDYFVPGSPVEGWAFQIGATSYYNTDQACGLFNIPGSITDYAYAGGVYTCTWEGDVPGMNIHITQTTSLPENAKYFVTRILICNNGPSAVTDMYYKRNVDPDNDEPWSGDYTTDNIIVYNPPTDPDALVTAAGLTYGCFLGLGAKDPNSRAAWGNFGTNDGTPSQTWHGMAGYSITGEEVADQAVSIAFYIDTIPSGGCQCLAYAYILNSDDLDEALDATSSFNVSANGVLVPADGNITVCLGDSVNFLVEGTPDYIWNWSSTAGAFSADTGTTVKYYTTTEADVTVAGTGGFCGDETRVIHVTVDPGPTSNAGMDDAICIGSSTNLNGSGGGSYQWIPSTGLDNDTIPNPTASPDATTTYSLVVTNEHGCKDTDNIVLTVNPLPNISAGPDVTICEFGSTDLSASGGVSYVWSPNIGLSCTACQTTTATPPDPMTYTVTGTDANGCVNTDDVDISINPLPVVDAGPDVTINIVIGESTILHATGGISYSWSPAQGLSCTNCQDPVAQPGDTTTYYVTVTDANGCQNIDSVTVNVIGEFDVDFPGAFTPNNDGINDYYKPLITGYGALDEYTIYNRWGQVVYSTQNPFDKGWDGTFNGKEQDIGSYVIILKATVLDQPQIFQKNFTLIR